LRHERLVDGQDEDLVVGEQVTLHSLAEPEPVQHRPEDGLVVHRQHRLVRLRLLLGVRVEQARGGRHVQALTPAQVGVVVDPDEVRLVRLSQSNAGGAVRLVADDQVEVRHPLALGAGDDVDRLVGGKDDGELVVLGPLADLRGQGLGVRGRRVDQVVNRQVLRGVGLADLHIGAHGIRAERDLGLLLPLAQALVEQLDRGNEEQDRRGLGLAAGRELLGDLQRRERLAGAAGHDQLPAVMRDQALADRRTGLPLVRQGGLLAGGRQNLLGPRPVDVAPVDLGLQQVADPDPHDRDGQVLELLLDRWTPVLRGRDDDPAGEPLLARRGEEGVDVGLGHMVGRVVELALHGAPPTGRDVLRHDVDAVVVGAAPAGPLLPQVDLLEPVRELRRRPQVARHQPLESGALLRRAGRTGRQPLEQVLQLHR